LGKLKVFFLLAYRNGSVVSVGYIDAYIPCSNGSIVKIVAEWSIVDGIFLKDV
jgi:hypothetical protein